MEQKDISKFEDFLQEEKGYSFDEAVTIGRYLYDFIEAQASN